MSIPYTGSSTTEKKVTMSVMRKAFFSMRKRCFKSFISISPSAIFMRIAAIIGNGRYWKNQLKRKNDITRVNIAMRKAEVLWVAQLFILRAVLINTAVAGSHPKNQEAIFASPRPRTSRSLSKCFLVIFSAIFADIIVSRIAIIAMTNAVMNSSFIRRIPVVIDCIPRVGNGFCQRENARAGNLSASKSISG